MRNAIGGRIGAIVSNFFNGAPPLNDQEAEDLGFTVNVNHLFGYKDLTDATDQLFGLYTKPDTILNISLDAAPPGMRSDWSMKASMENLARHQKDPALQKPLSGGVRG